jgi:hypothetical protein
MAKFAHKLRAYRTSDGKVIYSIDRDGVHGGYVVAVNGGYTVVDGPPGSNVIYRSMRDARGAIDRLSFLAAIDGAQQWLTQ